MPRKRKVRSVYQKTYHKMKKKGFSDKVARKFAKKAESRRGSKKKK